VHSSDAAQRWQTVSKLQSALDIYRSAPSVARPASPIRVASRWCFTLHGHRLPSLYRE
jgi:hypothetical protein